MAKLAGMIVSLMALVLAAEAVSLESFLQNFGPPNHPATHTVHDNRPKRQSYVFSQGVEFFIPDIRLEFSCDGRTFGYYADVANYCQIFHVCSPGTGQQFSFFCPNQTIFDQRLLVCEDEEMATPCEDAANYYGINQYFGTTVIEPSSSR